MPSFAAVRGAGEEAFAMEAFLGTHASYLADLNLAIQIATGGAPIFGTILARAKRFVSHGVCQSTVF
jgi:hypothetical protein